MRTESVLDRLCRRRHDEAENRHGHGPRGQAQELVGGQAGNHPVLLVDGVVAGVRHQRRSGRRTTITVEPLKPLTARQGREPAEQAERVGEVLEAKPESVVGKVTVGAHA